MRVQFVMDTLFAKAIDYAKMLVLVDDFINAWVSLVRGRASCATMGDDARDSSAAARA
jgi:hypothetical protein